MVSDRVILKNQVARDFEAFAPETKNLIWTVASGLAPTGTNEHIGYLAENLRRSDFVIEAAKKLIRGEPLVINWEDCLWLVMEECLKSYHEETYRHLLRMRQIMMEMFKMLAKQDPCQMDDFGHPEFHQLNHFTLTKRDKMHLIWGASYHDICRMGYPVEYWNTQGAFSSEQRLMLEYHARLFFNLGEFFNVDPKVIALSLLHHFPNKHYPQNGFVSRYQHWIKQPKFSYMLKLLVTVDVYCGATDWRSYRVERWGHQKVIRETLPTELAEGVGMGFVPFLEALHRQQGGTALFIN
jgi:hypothetical protein